ncbi:hypothetical protein NP493_185g03008 [Ridgeia piscesae]|uniref:Uncharacterized protein n=1 Tax=Ridgeia piscesae TaxID=27915 RepID=A0AAD9P2D4_RIDPI|nr:hypothetical protein NP493_185g03008 [Ridgeia piscesae]
MNLIANSVRQSYPGEAGYVNKMEQEIMDMWKALQEKAHERKIKLADSEKRHAFNEQAKDLDLWIAGVKSELREKEVPRDVTEAEALLKKHQDLKSDINANAAKFDQTDGLGRKILEKCPEDKDVKSKLTQLRADQRIIQELWKKKEKDLRDARELQASGDQRMSPHCPLCHLQVFLKEADQIDSVTASHEAFLEFVDLGSTVEGVEALFKRQEDFENRLLAQEERMKGLGDTADRLMAEKHPDSDAIDQRRREVVERRERVKDKCADRHNQLLSSQALQEFKRDAEELSDWIKEKYQTATDESYRDLTNLLPKLKKHQAFEAELQANKRTLDAINKVGQQMVGDQHPAGPEIKSTLTDLNGKWRDLSEKSRDKGLRLRQAAQQELFNKALEDAEAKLAEMERSVSSDDIGKDLRAVRDLLKKHQMLENEMEVNAENLKSIVAQGHEMARAGHFDSAGILKAVKDFDRRFNALKGPMAKRRQRLEDSLRWHQYNFDANTELQWIQEHMPAATSTDYGKSLVDAQNLFAKHKKLELALQGHQPKIDRVLDSGDGLIKAGHFATPDIKERQQGGEGGLERTPQVCCRQAQEDGRLH